MPHPGIAERRVPAYRIELPSPLWIRLDGEKVTKGRDISLRLRPDALTVHL